MTHQRKNGVNNKMIIQLFKTTFFVVLLVSSFKLSASDVFANDKDCQTTKDASTERGACIFVSAQKGFCSSCHAVDATPTNHASTDLGPSLAEIGKRYPDSSVLRAQIWDPTVGNPRSVMPPYGRHAILSEQEIDDLIAFLQTL